MLVKNKWIESVVKNPENVVYNELAWDITWVEYKKWVEISSTCRENSEDFCNKFNSSFLKDTPRNFNFFTKLKKIEKESFVS